jgi:hypothetical protein
MHANNFFSEFLDILKNIFWPVGASTPRSQSGFSLFFCSFPRNDVVFRISAHQPGMPTFKVIIYYLIPFITA